MRPMFTFLSAVALGAAVAASAAWAQPAGPQGPRAAASAASGPGYGPGRGAMHRGRWGSRYTPGWSMMTPEERDAHHRLMSQVQTREECRKAIDEHLALMEKRAGERGFTMRGPRADACAGLKR